MNYLAHIFLSGKDRQLQVGNFIGDFVKGKNYMQFPERIKQGILLHRQIDTFTDAHPAFLETVHLLRPDFHHYAGVMADMYYDYLLASHFEEFSPDRTLRSVAFNFYTSALLCYRWLPKRVKGFIFHFIKTNRLQKYGTYDGLHTAFEIMHRYKAPAIQAELGITFLQDNRDILLSQFRVFMPDVMKFVEREKK